MNKTYKRTTYYKSEKSLNPLDSPSTGSMVCYDGDIEYTEGTEPCVFIEIADCHQKIRLHQSHTDTTAQFIDKIDAIISQLKMFRTHLIYKSPHKPTTR